MDCLIGSKELKMVFSIEFFGMQRTITNADSIDVSMAGKTIVADILEYVRKRYPKLPLDERMLLITVNQEMASLDTVLRANDTVSFLPIIGGG